jgi:hypothetical protein
MMYPPAPTSSSPPQGGNAGGPAKPVPRRSGFNFLSLAGRSGLGFPSRVARVAFAGMLFVGLSACSSAPPPPDWQMGAKGSLERSTEAWLRGDSKIEAVEFARARAEVASTGRPDLVARVELVRCAARVASLDVAPCAGFDALAADAAGPELAYSRYLSGVALPGDVALLPKAHQVVASASGASTDPALAAVEDPLSRLVAAGVLLRRGMVSPATVQTAVDTASARGWRRPLLAWLRVAQERATVAGVVDEVARLQRRIDVLLTQPAR